MIIWLNGTFGVGKTSTADRLAALIPDGRVFDPEHFGISIAYAREALTDEQSLTLRARRQDVDPLPLLPVGAAALRTLLDRYLDAGLSKFVLRPTVTPSTWSEEVAWLADAVLDMQN